MTLPWGQLRNFHGVLNAHPAGAVLGDCYINNGTGVIQEGFWVLLSTGWTNATAAGGGVSIEYERPTNHSDLHYLPTGSYTGHQGQRCSCELADGRILILWHDAGVGLYITIIEMDEATFLTGTEQRDCYTYMLQLQEYATLELLTPEGADFCIASEVGDLDGEMVHIGFVSTVAGVGIDVYDCYFPSGLLLRPVPATVMPSPNIAAPYGDGLGVVLAEHINQIVALDQDCKHVSMAAQPLLASGPGVVAVYAMEQAVHGAYQIWSNFYDPTQAPGTRYALGGLVYVECLVNDPAMIATSHWCTVEADDEYCHCSYTNNDVDVGQLYYSYIGATGVPAVPGFWDGVLPVGIPVNSLGVLTGQFEDVAPSMVIIDNVDNARKEVVICIQRRDVIPSPIFMYNFTMDIIAGPPALFNEETVDVFDSTRIDNHRGYQLGASDTDYDTANNYNPCLFLFKTLAQGIGTNTDYIVQYRFYDEIGVLNEPWMNATIRAAIGLQTGFLDILPKVNYSYSYPVRPWKRANVRPWWPINAFFRMDVGWDAALSQYDVLTCSQYIR